MFVNRYKVFLEVVKFRRNVPLIIKIKLLQLKDTNEIAKIIVDAMIKNKPDVFDSIIKLEKAKSEFDEIKKEEEFAKYYCTEDEFLRKPKSIAIYEIEF